MEGFRVDRVRLTCVGVGFPDTIAAAVLGTWTDSSVDPPSITMCSIFGDTCAATKRKVVAHPSRLSVTREAEIGTSGDVKLGLAQGLRG